MSSNFLGLVAIGEKIKAARITYGLTQAQVALQLGSMQNLVSTIERGRSEQLLMRHLPKLCEILKLDQEDLLRDKALAGSSPRRKAEFEERLERMEERQIRIEALLEKLISVKRL